MDREVWGKGQGRGDASVREFRGEVGDVNVAGFETLVSGRGGVCDEGDDI